MNNILTQITNGPHNTEFYQLFGAKKKLYIHQNFDPLCTDFFYIRQSREGDDISSKNWQSSNLMNGDSKNIIISDNSAYKSNKAGYIFDIIKYIVQSGNTNFSISVSDYSRFSRNIEITEKIYNYLFDNNIIFYLNVDEKVYNYLEDYYKPINGLRTFFIDCQKFSDELSRELKKVHKKKKELRIKNKYSNLATSYFKWFITHNQKFLTQETYDQLEKSNFSYFKMLNYFSQTNGMFNNTKKFFYFYCPYTNLMIICPEELAYIEGLDSSIIQDFTKEDLEAIADSDNENLHYICYYRDNFDMTDMNIELN